MFKAAAFSVIRASGAIPLLRRLFAGRGAIIMFHEIHEAGDHELRTGTPMEFFDELIGWLRTNGWEIVSLDECVRRIASGEPSGRFAALTFDDGYRDNATRALPILQRHRAPFTVFVPTGAPTRTLPAWWLGLRELFRNRDRVEIASMERRFDCVSLPEKAAALEAVGDWIHEDYRRIPVLDALFEATGISLPALNERYFLDEDELRRLASDPLVTIGAHTSSHPAIALLDDGAAYNELADNRRYLQNLLQQPIEHVAFPYGNRRACGERDFALAGKAGFASAVTTKDAPVAKSDANLRALPRLGVGWRDSLASFDARISGLRHALDSITGRA